jgi:cyclopropane fatty-acyl-phospholipid synthase-like methyltransferase
MNGFVRRLVETCPPGGIVLGAPCGTGKYLHLVRVAGRRVVGIDQSAGMLAQARARGLAEELLHIGLQEMNFYREFDATMTIDAMENVSPEDWPVVLANLQRAVRRGGHLYMTVEECDEDVVDAAFEASKAAGLPAVRGEVIEGNVAGYHYYPGRARVMAWLGDAGLALVDEDYEQHERWGYRHLLMRSSPD